MTWSWLSVALSITDLSCCWRESWCEGNYFRQEQEKKKSWCWKELDDSERWLRGPRLISPLRENVIKQISWKRKLAHPWSSICSLRNKYLACVCLLFPHGLLSFIYLLASAVFFIGSCRIFSLHFLSPLVPSAQNPSAQTPSQTPNINLITYFSCWHENSTSACLVKHVIEAFWTELPFARFTQYQGEKDSVALKLVSFFSFFFFEERITACNCSMEFNRKVWFLNVQKSR